MRRQLGRFIVRCAVFGPSILSFLAFPVYIYAHRGERLQDLASGPMMLLLAVTFILCLIMLRDSKTFLGRADLSLQRWLDSVGWGGKGLQTPPGSRLRVFAEFIFSRRTYEQTFEPTLRDLLDEYLQALNERKPWKARWVRLRGYWSFWSAFIAQIPITALKTIYQIWKAIP